MFAGEEVSAQLDREDLEMTHPSASRKLQRATTAGLRGSRINLDLCVYLCVDVYIVCGDGGNSLVFSSTRRGRRYRRSHWARGHPIRLCGWRWNWVYKKTMMLF